MAARVWPALASAAGTAVAAGVGVAAWSFNEASRFTLRRRLVPVLPDGSAPLTLLHISDLHLVPTQRRKIEWVRSLAALEPDLVISTGDLMADSAALPSVTEALTELLEVPGAFVLGSNDYFAPRAKNPLRYFAADTRAQVRPDKLQRLPTAAMVEEFTRAGWLDLDNARGEVEIGGLRIEMVGVDDPHLDYDDMPTREGARGAGAAGFGGGGGGAPVLRLGVAHAPYRRILDGFRDDGVDLVLAGHTHGGQVCLPNGRAIVTNCDIDPERASGLHGWPGARPDRRGGADSVWLHVSAGLGTSPYAPFRLSCPPEATLLTLTERGVRSGV